MTEAANLAAPAADASDAGAELSYRDCKTLDQYLASYGVVLGEKAQRLFRPLHVPGVDPSLVDRDALPEGRRPFEAQEHAVSAVVKLLRRDKGAIIDAEPGAGKSLMGCVAVHTHARWAPLRRKRKAKGARKVPVDRPAYRCLIMCPDHLPPKWIEEVEDTIEGAEVIWIADWRDLMSLINRRETHHAGRPKRWPRPRGPEFYVIGRDRSKLDSSWRACGQAGATPDYDPSGTTTPGRDRSAFVRKVERWKDPQTGVTKEGERLRCPRCARPVMDKDGNPVGLKKLAATRMRCGGKVEVLAGKGGDAPEWEEVECGEPLWQLSGKPWRFAPATLAKKYLKGFFQYLIADEIHELKGDDTAQANALGSFAAVAEHFIGLTGTLTGGYAWHLFYLMYRTMPHRLLNLGLLWDDAAAFSRRYGKIETVVTTRYGGKGEEEIDAGEANKQSKGTAKTTRRENLKPGIMPQLVPDVMLGTTVNLNLDDIADNLPPVEQRVAEGGVEPDEEMRKEYEEVAGVLLSVAEDMLQRGDKRLLGAMNATLLGWPDGCHQEWGPVGYTDQALGFIPVVTPRRLDPGVIRPKEARLVEVVQEAHARGDQVWVFVEQTDRRDVIPRLEKILGDEGFCVRAMRASVRRDERMAWVKSLGREPDVMISHPMLIQTGVDFFDKRDREGGFNYNTLCFYQQRYNPFTMMQAAGRHRRIGQWLPCSTHYLYYLGTAQEACMALMGLKIKAASALRGNLSAEGIALLSGGEDPEMALAKALVDKVHGAARAWAKHHAPVPALWREGERRPRPRWTPPPPPAWAQPQATPVATPVAEPASALAGLFARLAAR